MSKFKVGDRVKVVDPNYSLPLGSEWKILHTFIKDGCEFVKVHEDDDDWYQNKNEWFSDRFELLTPFEQDDITPKDIQGIAKPILEERKIGKIEMDLFDSGFPNAILEVAKVMTWAGQNKGYKPHDWTNLPNAEVEFSAAASRHKMKSLIQKVGGIVAQERVDEESGIVHLAHEAFNVLAQLELVLRGKIK